MTQLDLIDVGERKHYSRFGLLLAIADKMGYDITYSEGCCEPGYEDKPCVFANWNKKTKYHPATGEGENYTPQYFEIIDDTMPRLAKLFKKLGYSVEWEDEWAVCSNCGKAFRTSPDSYSWKPYYAIICECCILCAYCIKDNPTDYLDDIKSNPNKCLTFDIDLSEYGYEQYNENSYESGWHPGQNDDPKEIAKELKEKGITDFVFVQDEQSQFYIGFSVWIKKGDSNEENT